MLWWQGKCGSHSCLWFEVLLVLIWWWQSAEGKEACYAPKAGSSTLGPVSGLSTSWGPTWATAPIVSSWKKPCKTETSEEFCFWGRAYSQLLPSGILLEPFHIMQWSSRNCIICFNFDGDICHSFCFLIFLALFVNPCRKPLFFSPHCNSFKRICLICFLI